MENKRGRAALTAAGVLIATKALMMTFAAAAEPPNATGGVSSFLGIPFVEINEGTRAKPNDLVSLGNYKMRLQGDVHRAMKRVNLSPNELTDRVHAKIDQGDISQGHFYAIPPQLKGENAEYYSQNTNQDGFALAYAQGTSNGGIIVTRSKEQMKIEHGNNAWAKKFLPNSAPLKMSPEDYFLFAKYHEMGHIVGANEQQADQIGAIRFLQDHPDKRYVIEIIRDQRQLRAFHDQQNNVEVSEKGQAMVAALDEILDMAQSKIKAFTDKDFRDLLVKGTFNQHPDEIYQSNYDAATELAQISGLLAAKDPGFFKEKTNRIGETYLAPDVSSRTMQNLSAALQDIRAQAQETGVDMKIFDQLQQSATRLFKGDYQQNQKLTVTSNANVTATFGNGLN